MTLDLDIVDYFWIPDDVSSVHVVYAKGKKRKHRGFFCIDCSLLSDGDAIAERESWLIYRKTAREMMEHLKEHEKCGDFVPDDVYATLSHEYNALRGMRFKLRGG